MGAYLVDHAPYRSQFRKTRRARPTGTIGGRVDSERTFEWPGRAPTPPAVADTPITEVADMADRICSVDDCESPGQARGWCRKHYLRWYKTGDPLGIIPKPTVTERLWAKIERSPSGCWIWNGAKCPKGYGRFRHDGENRLAHRVAWELMVAPVPEGLELDHLCRTAACVNPSHLEPVTPTENKRRVGEAATCRRGHPFDTENTYIAPATGTRRCRTCWAASKRRAR